MKRRTPRRKDQGRGSYKQQDRTGRATRTEKVYDLAGTVSTGSCRFLPHPPPCEATFLKHSREAAECGGEVALDGWRVGEQALEMNGQGKDNVVTAVASVRVFRQEGSCRGAV